MKKVLITKLVVLCIIMAILIPISISIISGYGFNWFGNRFNWHYNSNIEGYSELNLQESFSGISNIRINMIDESIDVLEHDKDTVEIKYYGNKKDDILVKKDGDTLNVERRENKDFFGLFNFNFNFGSKQNRIEIYVPKGEINNANLYSVSGGVDVKTVTSSLNVDTVSGSIEVFAPGKDVNASSVSGNIRIYETYDDIRFDTVSGNVRVKTKEGTIVKGDTVSGDVRSDLCGRGSCGYTVDFDSMSGAFKDSFNNQKVDGETNISFGNGSVKFDVNTVSGSFKLEEWD